MNTPIKWPAPYPGAHWLDEREDRAVLDVLHQRSLFRYYGLKQPKHVEQLEAAARAFYDVKYALGVNSGTGALFTAMTALGIGRGSEVIVPVHMAGAPCDMKSIMAIARRHHLPVLEDCAQANGGSFAWPTTACTYTRTSRNS